MNDISNSEYIINSAQHIASIDENTVAIVSSKEQYILRGVGISIAVADILNEFTTCSTILAVVDALSNKFTEDSIRRLIYMFIDKGVLLKSPDNDSFDETALEKFTFFVSKAKTFDDLVEKASTLKIGIVGTSTLVNGLLEYFLNSSLVKHFFVGTLNADNRLYPVSNDVIITEYNLFSDLNKVQEIVVNSDFVIAASSQFDHHFFNCVNSYCYAAKKEWIRVALSGFIAEIGPLFIPGETCCYSCLRAGMLRNLTDNEIILDKLMATDNFHKKMKGNILGFSTLYPLNSIASGIACAESLKYTMGTGSSIVSEVLSMNCADYTICRSVVLRDYTCSVCSDVALP